MKRLFLTLAVSFSAIIVNAQQIDSVLNKVCSHPFYFSVKVPDGNYKVKVTLGASDRDAETTVRAESRRLFVDPVVTRKKEYVVREFTVNKRTPIIDSKNRIKTNKREAYYLNWDDSLTLEFNGKTPAVQRVQIEPVSKVTQLILCGNSTVTDQNYEPYASWGQMVTRWFSPDVAVVNLAESGLTASSFIGQNRLEKAVSMVREGDFVFCEFGHNDQKENSAGSGAWYNYSFSLKKLLDEVRKAGATVVFVTPTQRRKWDESHTHIVESHGDYPDAMRAVAKREGVPVIELHEMTRTFFETLGYELSKKSLVHYPANTFPGQTQALEDNTHFNPYGAYEVAKMVVMGMKELQLPLCQYLTDDWQDYDVFHPDIIEKFVWYTSPTTDATKPAGN